MRIIGKGFNALLNVVRHVVDLFRQAILSQQEAKRAEQLSNNGKFLEAVSLANKILERWSSPSPSLLEHQFHQWAMSDRIKRLREQLNTWQTDALIEYNAALRQAHQIAVQGRFQDALAQFEPVHHQFPQAGGLYLLRELRRIVDGKRHFYQGLLADKAGDFQVAAEHYQNAIMYVLQGATSAPKARSEKSFTRQAPAPNTELIDKDMDGGRNSRRRCTQCMVKKNGLINENKTAIKNATNILSSAVTKVSKSVSSNYIEAVSLVTSKPKTSKNRKIGSNAASTHSTQ